MRKLLFIAFFLSVFATFTFPLSASALDGQFIVINKTSNELAYYENHQLHRIFSVATGKSPSLTPEGNFIIVNKIINRPYYKDQIPGGDPSNPLGDRWLGLNARGTWGTTYAIHGNNNPDSIGKYVSLGCVRMYDEEVRWLFDQVKINTPVIITASTDSFDKIAAANGYAVTSSPMGATPAITRELLKRGSDSEEVTFLQQTLTQLRYFVSEINGIFNEETDKAVRQFQIDHDLTVDGIVGPETKKALRNLAINTQGNDPANLPTDVEKNIPENQPNDAANNPPLNEPNDPILATPPNQSNDPVKDTLPNQSNDPILSTSPNQSNNPIIGTPPAINTRPSSETVKQIQGNLKRLGYYIGDYDTIYGSVRPLLQ